MTTKDGEFGDVSSLGGCGWKGEKGRDGVGGSWSGGTGGGRRKGAELLSDQDRALDSWYLVGGSSGTVSWTVQWLGMKMDGEWVPPPRIPETETMGGWLLLSPPRFGSGPSGLVLGAHRS